MKMLNFSRSGIIYILTPKYTDPPYSPEVGFLDIPELEINSRITRDSRVQD